MTKTDEKILQHLKPYYKLELSDVYFCSIDKYNKNYFMTTVFEKVSVWVEKNGGKIQKLSDKMTIRNRKGYLVRIIFPCYNHKTKKNMKELMATLY